jgi:hypothetical protein
MKKLILSLMMSILVTTIAVAQTTKKPTRHASTTPSKKKTSKSAVKRDSLDERKNYEWKNGQKATPTGNEARGINETQFSAEKKDTSAIKQKRKPKQ